MEEREIIAYKNVFVDFYNQQDFKTQKKIEYVLNLVRYEKRIPVKFLKYLENSKGIYEI